jgi:hypothetical protein
MALSKRIRLLSLILIALILFGGGAFFYARETPRYSIYLLKRALLAQDMEQVTRYADMDRIVEATVERAFGKMDREAARGTEGRFNKREFLRQALPSLKKGLKEQARGQILAYLSDAKVRQSLEKATIWMFRIDQEGERAHVSYDGKERFLMERAPGGGYWRIVDVFWE